MSLKRFLFLAIILSIVLTQSCDNRKNNIIYYITQDENYFLPLQSVFRGFNLSFELQAQELQDIQANIVNTVSLSDSVATSNLGTILGFSTFQFNTYGGRSYAVLTKKDAGKYNAYYSSTGQVSQAPNFQTVVTFVNDQNVNCFGILMITQTLAVADCTNNVYDPNAHTYTLMNQNFLIDFSDSSVTSQQDQALYGISKVFARESVLWTSDAGNQYIFRLLTSGGYSGSESYILPYLVQPQNKQLQLLPPITASQLNIQSLNALDIQVSEDSVYILDQNAGLISFQYSSFNQSTKNVNVFTQNLTNTAFTIFGNTLILTTKGHLFEYEFTTSQQNLLNKYDLPVTIGDLNQVQVNSDYIFVQTVNGYIYVYKRGQTDFNNLAYQNYTGVNTVFAATLSNNFVIIQNNTSANFKLSEPQLSLYVGTTSVQLNTTIIAYSQQNSGDIANCTAMLNFTPLAQSNDKTLYYTNYYPYSYVSLFAGHNYELNLQDSYVGANIGYNYSTDSIQQQQKKLLRVESEILDSNPLKFNLQLFGEFNIDLSYQTKDIQFFRSFSHDEFSFITFIQNSQNTLYSYLCEISPSNPQEVTCGDPGLQINFQSQVLHLGVGQTEDGTPIIAFMLSAKVGTVSVYTITGNYLYSIETTTSQYDDIGLLNDKLFIVDQKSRIVYFYKLQSTKAVLITTIDNSYTSSWKLKSLQFTPQYVHADPFYPDFIFVQTFNLTVVVIQVVQQPIFVFEVTTDGTPASINVQITPYSLLIVSLNGDQSYIQEYSTSDLSNIVQTKVYPLFGYNISSVQKFSASDYSQLFYVIATLNGTNNLLVYRTGQPEIEVLYTVQMLSQNDWSKQTIIMGATGKQDDYLFIWADSLYTYYVPSKPRLQVFGKQTNSQQLVQYSSFSLIYEDFDRKKSYKQTAQLVLVNGMDYAGINLDVIQQAMDGLLDFDSDSSGSQNRSWSDKGWYDGNIAGLAIDCNDCNGTFQIINHVQQVNQSLLNLTDVVDFLQSDDLSTIIIQTVDTQYIFNNSLQLTQKPISLGVDTDEVTCDRVGWFQSSYINMSYTLCFNSSVDAGYYVMIPIRFSDSYAPFPGSALALQEITQITNFKISSGFIFVSQPGISHQKGSLYVYRLNFATSPLVVYQKYNNTQLQVSSLDVASFEVVQYNQTNSKVFILDKYSLIAFDILNVDPKQTFNPVQVNLSQYFSGLNLTTQNVQLIQMKLLSFDNGQNQVTLIVATQSEAAFNVSIDLGKNTVSINYIFMSYGVAQTMTRIAADQNLYMASFFNESTNAIMFALFDTNDVQSSQLSDSMPFVVMKGGYNVSYVFDSTKPLPFGFFRLGSDNQQQIFAMDVNNTGNLSSLQYYPKNYLVANDNKFKEGEKINFIILSDFVTRGQLLFQVKIGGLGGSGFPWWAILLIVLGSLIIIGIIAYFVVKKIRKNRNKTLSDSQSNALSMPLVQDKNENQ